MPDSVVNVIAFMWLPPIHRCDGSLAHLTN